MFRELVVFIAILCTGQPTPCGTFRADGFSSKTNRISGIIEVNLESLEDCIVKYPAAFDKNAAVFVIAHEASHALLGNGSDDFFAEKQKEKVQGLPKKIEENTDQLAAKVMNLLKRPIESALKFNAEFKPDRDSGHRNPMIANSFAEGFTAWREWNKMGPLCGNLVADQFRMANASASLIDRLEAGTCKRVSRQ